MSLTTVTPVAPARVDFDRELEELRDDGDVDYTGWFCVRTSPFPCPAPGCDFVADYMTAAHLIVVWPRKDDPSILAAAYNASLVDRKPSIVEYEVALGPCLPYDQWARLGRPVHGLRNDPEGWNDRARSRL